MAIIEAMACGRAVVVSDLGGAQELFTNGVTGLGHRAADDQDLAESIGRLVSNPAVRRALGTNGREHVVAKFPVTQMAQAVWKIYSDLAVKRRVSHVVENPGPKLEQAGCTHYDRHVV